MDRRYLATYGGRDHRQACGFVRRSSQVDEKHVPIDSRRPGVDGRRRRSADILQVDRPARVDELAGAHDTVIVRVVFALSRSMRQFALDDTVAIRSSPTPRTL